MERTPGKQLFADDFFIESLSGARRVLNPPEKRTVDAPLDIRLGQPWDAGFGHFGPVHYDEVNRRFRLYYSTRLNDRTAWCALDSDDGLRWQRPTLGLVEYGGSTANNITNVAPDYWAILWDPHETDEARRWKRIDNMPTGTGADGQRIWQAQYSRDGYDWQHVPPGPHNRQKMLMNFGSPAETFGGTINPDARYIFYSQRGSSRRTRVLGRRDSDDFLTWSGLRTVMDQDLDDPAGTEFYSASFDMANRTDGGLHILLLHTFLTDLAEPYGIPEAEKYWGGEKGPKALAARIEGFVETQFAVSRDTVAWRRYRQPFLARGEPGAVDWGMLYGERPILHEGKLWFFYSGYPETHGGRSPQPYEHLYATGRRRLGKGVATLRPDGFVSVEAESFAPGFLTTHRFRQESGGTVRVNADASAGELRCEVLRDTGEPIPGYTLADCDPVRADAPDAVLSWRGQPGWPGVSAERQAEYPDLSPHEFYIKLRFAIAPGTKLYSLTLDPPEVTMWNVRVPGRID